MGPAEPKITAQRDTLRDRTHRLRARRNRGTTAANCKNFQFGPFVRIVRRSSGQVILFHAAPMLTVLPPAGGDDKHDRIVDAKPRLALLLLLERPRDPLRVIPAPQGCGSCERNRKKPRPEGCEAGAGLVTHEHHPPFSRLVLLLSSNPMDGKGGGRRQEMGKSDLCGIPRREASQATLKEKGSSPKGEASIHPQF